MKRYTGLTGLAAVCGLLLVGLAPPGDRWAASVAADEGEGRKATPESTFERLTKAMPELVGRAGMPAVRQPAARLEQFNYTRVRVARLTSDTTARVTISSHASDDEIVYGIMTVNLSYYRGRWTVSSSTTSGTYAERSKEPAAKLLLLLDEFE